MTSTINGDGITDAFYDAVLDISWLADGNAGAGSRYDSGPNDGLMTWPDAMAWTANLNVFGLTGWRLPTMNDPGPGGCSSWYGGTDCGYNTRTISADGTTFYSEWAYLYYVTLGNLGGCDETGDCARLKAASAPDYLLLNTGAFRNLHAWVYWTDKSLSPDPFYEAWLFHTLDGWQGAGTFQFEEWYAMAVRPGDVPVVAQVTEPQAALLTLTALGVLLASTRRRRFVRIPAP